MVATVHLALHELQQALAVSVGSVRQMRGGAVLLASVDERVVRREQEKKWAVKRVQLRGGGGVVHHKCGISDTQTRRGLRTFPKRFPHQAPAGMCWAAEGFFQSGRGYCEGAAALIRLTCSGSASSPNAAPLNNGKRSEHEAAKDVEQ